MEPDLIILFCIIGGALVLFVSGAIPIDNTSILVMVALMATGILTPEEGISGFGNTATITVLALLILSEGLKNTGAVDAFGDRLLAVTSRHHWMTLPCIMIVAACCSAFINTTAVVAVFIPIVFKMARQANIKAGMLLMPLSFAAMVGGASTMIGTSTNLLINSIAQNYGVTKFTLFELSWLGVVLFAVLLVYMLSIGIKTLGKKHKHIEVFDREVEAKNYLTEVVIPQKSGLIGQTFDSLKLYDKTEYALQRLMRNGLWVPPQRSHKIEEGDIITIKTNIHELININNNPDIRILTNTDNRTVKPAKKNEDDENENKESRALFEALVVPNSNLIRRKIRDVDFQRFYGVFPLAVRRGGVVKGQKLMDHRLKVGDILLMDGESWVDTERSKHDWVVVQELSREKIERDISSQKKQWISIGILALVILLAVNEILPILVSAWMGVILMFLTQCISVKKAYENVEWKVIFLLAGIIPLGAALSKTGGDQYIADFLIKITAESQPWMVVSLLFLLTTLITGIISNQATAVLLVPIAIKVAQTMGMDPQPLLVAILFGANTSFITPVGYQTNAMIYGPGNYSFMDFVKVGGGLSLLFWLLCSFLISWMYL